MGVMVELRNGAVGVCFEERDRTSHRNALLQSACLCMSSDMRHRETS
jgi:hypothetical protein